MMSSSRFTYHLRTRIIFGPGTLVALGEQAKALGAERVLVVTDPGIVASGICGKSVGRLEQAGLHVRLFSDVSPNPRDGECQAAARAAMESGAQLVVGVGGGSPLDCAKAAAALVTNGGRVADWEDPKRLAQEPLPLIAVPTTAGTGSEVSFVAVITDEERHYKMALFDPRIVPQTAILDPDLTLSVPRGLTAATGMDALVHCIEAYTAKVANPVSDALALRAVELIAGALPAAVADGSNAVARSDMLLGSLLAGMAFGNANVAAVHCMAQTLGAQHDMQHGVGCAIFLPFVMEYNLSADPRKHANVAAALGVDTSGLSDAVAAARGVDAVRRLEAVIGMPRLRDLYEISEEEFRRAARESAEHILTPGNAREIGYEGYLRLFHAAYDA
jgi:alcohol dehydrogenase